MGLQTTYTNASANPAAALNATNAKVNELEQRLGLPLVGDNATDNSAAFKTQYAAGQREWWLGGNGIPRTYRFNDTIFLDDASIYDKVVIHANGSRIVGGSGLLTTDDYGRDNTVKWLFAGNNVDNRSAGKFTMSDAARPTGMTTGGMTRLYVFDATFDGLGAKVGLFIGNRTAAHMGRVTMDRAYTLVSASDYTDSVVVDHCYARDNSGPAEAALVHQIGNGDGLEIRACKADSAIAIANVSFCRGVVITGNVTGRMIFSRSDVTAIGWHHEGETTGTPGVVLRNSSLTLEGCVMYARTGTSGTPATSVGFIEIDDNPLGSVWPSSVIIRGGKWVRRINGDIQNGPLISYTSAITNTKLRLDGLESFTIASGEPSSSAWLSGAGPKIVGPSVMDAALLAGSGLLGYGSCELIRSNNGWKLGIKDNPMASIQRTLTSPSFVPTAPAAGTPGTLTDGTTYYYRVATRNSAGQYSIAANEQGQAANARRQVKLVVTCPEQPADIVVWRGTTPGTYDRYVVLPAGANITNLWDTGVRISGEPWVTSSIPTVPTVNNTSAS